MNIETIGVVKRGESWWFQMSDGTYHSGADGIVPYIRVVRAQTKARVWAGMAAWVWADFRTSVYRLIWGIVGVLKAAISHPLYRFKQWLTRKLTTAKRA